MASKDITNSIQPDHGFFGDSWPSDFAIPRSLSTGGWTTQSPGFEQQTFLGASITSFSMNGAYGDSSSTLSVDLVVDEFNKSDETGFGLGDDVYHNGERDQFRPPFVGSPVFFKFGTYRSSVKDSFSNAIDELINGVSEDCNSNTYTTGSSVNINDLTTISDTQKYDMSTGTINNQVAATKACALTFGGILQSYTQNRGTNGNPLYSVQVTDPREILSNVKLLLNNYTGSVHDSDNIFNIYGFLEYDLSAASEINGIKDEIKRSVQNDGTVLFTGTDTYLYASSDASQTGRGQASSFPITGTGFARRSEQGIPFYRVQQALTAMMEYNGALPQEYKDAKFANTVNFRGFKYVVDLTGLPSLPDFYYLNFDEMSLLELALEICDVTNRDLFVSLLPVVDNEYCRFLYNRNLRHTGGSVGGEDVSSDDGIPFIAGIIRLDALDRSKQQDVGAIKTYLDNLASEGIYVENRDVGFEVSNITTDKFIAGAQETDMYFFSTLEDRTDDDSGTQYNLDSMLSQQVIPYYGTFGNNVVTVPKGYGAYQQILLDARNLTANGVGTFYVATEMEMRCALISYDKWKAFLMEYNDKYMESVEEDDILETQFAALPGEAPENMNELPNISDNYDVTVPRSVWPCLSKNFDTGGLPASPCNPPYGYPLYYKRATQIGIPEGGLTKITYTWNSQILPAFAKLKSMDKNSKNYQATLNSAKDQVSELFNIKSVDGDTPTHLAEIRNFLMTAIDEGTDLDFNILDEKVTNVQQSMESLPRLAKKGTENAQKIWNFIKGIASECLGKKFLVKLPRKVNFNYDQTIERDSSLDEGGILGVEFNDRFTAGPFGFRPFPKGAGMANFAAELDPTFVAQYRAIGLADPDLALSTGHTLRTFIKYEENIPSIYDNYRGALSTNFNPFTNLIESNYKPEPQGGFFKRELFKDLFDESTGANLGLLSETQLPPGMKQQLIPNILSTFTNDNGRINAYVRFDHSENLSFDGMSQDSFIQSKILDGRIIPDLNYGLDNTSDDNTGFTRFYNQNDEDDDKKTDEPLDPQVAFVKCSVEDKIYFAPKLEERRVRVAATEVVDEPLITLPKQVIDNKTNKVKYTHGYQISNFKPTSRTTGPSRRILDFVRMDERDVEGEIIFENVVDVQLENIAQNDAYALITLPGRISPTVDSRFRDGTFQAFEKVKHYLTMDVVKGVPGFEEPKFRGNFPNLFRKGVTPDKSKQAKKIYDTVLDKMQYALPQQIDLAMPSPVIPDLVVLPLTSTERFYGPWISSQIDTRTDAEKRRGVDITPRYKDLGGAIEFVKDENLAPWNYFGYSQMNDAGKLRATFANSLLLLSERGGFVVPAPPTGLTLGRELANAGPLVTNISVDISTQGIKTTTQLDLYTVSFGKLQKQKEQEIAKSSRERKKLSDERNALIRKGIGKGQSDENYNKIYQALDDKMKSLEAVIDMNMAAKLVPSTDLVGTVKSETVQRFLPGAELTNETKVKSKAQGVDTAMQNKNSLASAGEKFPSLAAAQKSFYNSAGGDLGSMFTPASMDPSHENMPYKHDPNIKSKDSLYFDLSGDTDNDGKLDITIYED